jgi:hypothetical protein
VACCDADHAGEWEGEWEECEVVADHGAACDVRIMQGGELCRGVPRRFVRVGVPRSSSASPGGSAHSGRGDKVFGGAAFLVTGLDDDGEKAALLALPRSRAARSSTMWAATPPSAASRSAPLRAGWCC